MAWRQGNGLNRAVPAMLAVRHHGLIILCHSWFPGRGMAVVKSRLWALLAIALLVAVIALIWRDARDQDVDQARLQSSLDELRLRLDLLEREQARLQDELQTLQRQSVKGMVEQANAAILDGWQALVETIEKQLREARAALPVEEPSAPAEGVAPDSQ